MITELLKKDDKVVGAIGFHLEEEAPFIIEASSVVLCTGAGSFKAPGWPVAPNTFDGHMMAYRAGAELSGKEGNDWHTTNTVYPYYTAGNYGDKYADTIKLVAETSAHSRNSLFRDGLGGVVTEVTEEDIENLLKPQGPPPGEGRAPTMVVGGVCGGAEHRCDGIFPQDKNCFSRVEGLYAAGDALCTGGVGLLGSATPGCAVQGAIAGEAAAEYSKNATKLWLDDKELDVAIEKTFAAREREIGYSGDYVIQLVQSIMMPFYVLYVKKQDRLEDALARIEYLKEHFVPLLLANDMHELRVAHEASNIVLNAEMKLRASLFRTESRGSHYREDIPARDDENWLAWVVISKSGDDMLLSKRPVEDLPEYDMTYEERYTDVYPGEVEYLQNK
jgi:succinate dehydrogenase/fumarate reductase flavoprotein subunit